MVDTVTQNYGWTKPSVGGDQATWGTLLNADLDLIDAQVFANQTAAKGSSFVGEVKMQAGKTLPANWLWCDGSAVSRTTYATLFAEIGTTYGAGDGSTTFNLPPTPGRGPIGCDSGANWPMGKIGGEQNHTLTIGEMPVHPHGVNDNTHTHGMNDPTHVHPVSDPTHGHSGSQDPHNHDVGQVLTPSGGGNASAGGGWGFNDVRTDTQQPAVHIGASGTGISIGASGTGVSVKAAATGITIQNAGGGAAHNNMQPYLVVRFIIRYQ